MTLEHADEDGWSNEQARQRLHDAC